MHRIPVLPLLASVVVVLSSVACDPPPAEGEGEEGEGDVAEGEGDVVAEGEGDTGEGEGEGDVVGEGEGDVVVGGEGEGDVVAGEGEGEPARELPAGDAPAGPNAYILDGQAPVVLGAGDAQRTVRDGHLVTFLRADLVDFAFVELAWPQGQTGTFDCARGGNASVHVNFTNSVDNDGPCEIVVTEDGGVDGAVAATYRGYVTDGLTESTFIGTASADVVRLGDDHLSGVIDGTFEVGLVALDQDRTDEFSTVLTGTIGTQLGQGAVTIIVPRGVAATCGDGGTVVINVVASGVTLTTRSPAASACTVEVFANDGVETALTYAGPICVGATCGNIAALSVYVTAPQLPAEVVTASMNGGATTTAANAANITGQFLPSGNPQFIPDQASLLFNVDDASSEFAVALTLRANSPMLPGTYPCSAAQAGNRVSEAEIIQFGQRFASTSCSVTIDAFEVAGGVRFMSGSFSVDNATKSGSATVHSGSGSFVVHF